MGPLPRALCPERQKAAARAGGSGTTGGGRRHNFVFSIGCVLRTQTARSGLIPVSTRRWRWSGSLLATPCAGEDRGGMMACWLHAVPSPGSSIRSGVRARAGMEVPKAKCSQAARRTGVRGGLGGSQGHSSQGAGRVTGAQCQSLIDTLPRCPVAASRPFWRLVSEPKAGPTGQLDAWWSGNLVPLSTSFTVTGG